MFKNINEIKAVHPKFFSPAALEGRSVSNEIVPVMVGAIIITRENGKSTLRLARSSGAPIERLSEVGEYPTQKDALKAARQRARDMR